MKAAFAAVLAGLQSLQANEVRERPVDRLGALGAIQRAKSKDSERTAALASLGVDLIAYKFGHRAASKAAAEEKLADILRWESWKLKLSPRKTKIIAGWVMQEWFADVCPNCSGAKQVPDHRGLEGAQPMKACQTCSGTGKRRYSDYERTEAMGEAHARAVAEAHGILAWAESLAVRQAKQMLERW